jgi:hypothetical protein
MAREAVAKVTITGEDQASDVFEDFGATVRKTFEGTERDAQQAQDAFNDLASAVEKAFSGTEDDVRDAEAAIGKFSQSIRKGFVGTSEEVGKAERSLKEFEQSVRKGFGGTSDEVQKAQESLRRFGAVTKNELEDAARSVKRAESAFVRFGRELRSRFVITLGDVERAARAAFQAIRDSSNLEAQTRSLELQLARQGKALNEFLGELDAVAEGTVSSAKLIQASSTAILLGIPAERIAELLEVARVQAVKTGQDVATAFDDIAKGIGRGSPLILDNLGIVIDLNRVYGDAADALGKTASQLSAVERNAALTNEVIRQGSGDIERFQEANEGLAVQIQQGQAIFENARTTFGNFLSAFGLGALTVIQTVGLGFLQLGRRITVVIDRIADLAINLPLVGDAFLGIRDRAINATNALDDWRNGLRDNIAQLSESTQAAIKLALGIRETTDELDANTTAQNENAKATADNTEATEEQTEAYSAEVSQLERVTSATEGYNETLREQTQLLALTGREFDRLAQAAGRAQAVQAALDAGGRLILGGTRVELATGGSRLVGAPGFQSQLPPGLSPFGQGRTGAFSDLVPRRP